MLPITKKVLLDENLVNKRWNYRTTYSPYEGLEKLEEFKPFCNYVADLGMQFMIKQGYRLEFNRFNPRLFASEMVRGDFHNTHAHPNSVLSGIFYLQVPKNSSAIVFTDPRAIRKVVKRQTEFETASNIDELVINPHTGMLLMWESWFEHYVPENYMLGKKDKRITLVFNLNAN